MARCRREAATARWALGTHFLKCPTMTVPINTVLVHFYLYPVEFNNELITNHVCAGYYFWRPRWPLPWQHRPAGSPPQSSPALVQS